MPTAHPPEDLTIEERLRLHARDICTQSADDWRRDAAEAMGCAVDDVGAGPVSRHRDSEPPARSNFRVVLRSLRATDERVREARFRHWGVGWIDEIVVPLDNPAVIQRIEAWVTVLRDHAVADEHDLADLEAEEEASTATFDIDDDDGPACVTPDRRPAPSETRTAIRTRRRLDSPSPPKPIDPPSL